MADVFISYKKERVAAVAHLAEILEAHGYSVWFDVRSLPFGPSFVAEIESALHAATVTLVLWCSLSKTSKWVMDEASKAEELGRYLPAHMEPKPAPLGRGTDQALNLIDWDGDPESKILTPLLQELAARTGKMPAFHLEKLAGIRQRWIEAGRQDYLTWQLTAGLPTEATLERAFPAAIQATDLNPPPSPVDRPTTTPSARAWQEVTGSRELADFDHFLAAFPNAPEAEYCRRERARLAEEIKSAAETAEREAAFAALPKDGWDPRPLDAFVDRYPGTMEAFRAARLAADTRTRIAATSPDEETRKVWEREARDSILSTNCVLPERAPHLKVMDLSGTKVTDLAPFRYMIALTELSLRGTQISDLTPLRDITALSVLNLGLTQVSDLSPLKGVNALTCLSLGGTRISNLVPLRDMTVLSKLYLSGTRVSDLTPLRDITALTELHLDKTLVSDLTPLRGMNLLKELHLHNTLVYDLAPLRELPNLRVLDLSGTNVRTLNAVEHVAKITLPNGITRKGKRAL